LSASLDEPDALFPMSSGGYGSGSDRAMSPPEAMSSPELTEEEMICNICLVRGCAALPCMLPLDAGLLKLRPNCNGQSAHRCWVPPGLAIVRAGFAATIMLQRVLFRRWLKTALKLLIAAVKLRQEPMYKPLGLTCGHKCALSTSDFKS
jgi:hypothetical protein